MISRNEYIRKRLSDLSFNFSASDSKHILDDYRINGDMRYKRHSLLSKIPDKDYDDKGDSDQMSVLLWNEIFRHTEYTISRVDQVKAVAKKFIDDMDRVHPRGEFMSERDMIRYVQAQSSSAFIGIQSPSKSRLALESFRSTLHAHSHPNVSSKPWLLSNLTFIADHIASNPSLMERRYADMCLSAKISSASIPGYKGSFRDFVLSHTLEDVMQMLDSVPKLFYLGLRHDRRGKMRAICSMPAQFRIIDFILNNGSYGLCEHDGILSKYTTEGYSSTQMWPVLKSMSDRSSGFNLACIDYKGYDTQISLDEYLSISWLLNANRIRSDNKIADIFRWYANWMRQPKPLVTRNSDGLEVVTECYQTLASGLHGTHSFENLIGISAYLEARKRGINVKSFWTNGDDQNALVHSESMDSYINFMNEYFRISWDKSLVSHRLGVWGKLWFAEGFSPTWEIGTFRSIWEREGGEINLVEESKVQSNFCKIIQVAIVLIRLDVGPKRVSQWIRMLCSRCNLNPDLIPKNITSLTQIPSNSSERRDTPRGLASAKQDLFTRTFSIRSLGVNNYYDMLLSMYRKRLYFSLNPINIEYYPRNTVLYLESGVDYSIDDSIDVPWVYKSFIKPTVYTEEHLLARSIIQGSNSYDGPVAECFAFHDMLSLAYAIHRRNSLAWERMQPGS